MVSAVGRSFSTAPESAGTSAGVERGDQDPHGAAAGEADLERGVVGDSVLAQPGAAAVQDFLRLADHGRARRSRR